MAAESGLRSSVLMDVRYRHVMEDLENQTIPVAVRLEPRFHVGKKAAGYTFLGAGSVSLLRDCIDDRLVEAMPDARLISRSYYGIWAAIHRASRKAGLDPKIQTCHGFRKYFENALDDASVDHEKKMIIEGHFAGTRAQHYTDRDIEQLRDVYRSAYPFIHVEPSALTIANNRDGGSWSRFSALETQMASQKVLEERMTALEDQLRQMKHLTR